MENYIEDLIKRYPALDVCKDDIKKASDVLIACFEKGNKLLVAGNGGSYADSEHIAGELMKSFCLKRPICPGFAAKLKEVNPVLGEELASKLEAGFPVIALGNHQALNTAYMNDVENAGALTFAQQVNVFGKEGDIFLGITTSGNSKNIIYAATVAKAKGMKVIGLTGKDGGKLKDIADIAIVAPGKQTHLIQEYHLPIYHALCLQIEDHFFNK